MAYGLDLCENCPHAKAFRRAGEEPAYIRVVNTGAARALMSRFGVTTNKIELQDENCVTRARMTIPDAALDLPGAAIKQELRNCRQPDERGRCGGEMAIHVLVEQRIFLPINESSNIQTD